MAQAEGGALPWSEGVLNTLADVRARSRHLRSARGGGAGAEQQDDWTDAEWRGAFERLFLCAEPGSRLTVSTDDLLFFVREGAPTRAPRRDERVRAAAGDEDEEPRVRARRWAPEVPAAVAEGTDWRRSVYLSLVAHTSFTLTVAVCSRAAMEAGPSAHGAPGSVRKPHHRVTRRVFCSPSHATVNLATERADTVPAQTYPRLYFAVEDFSDAFSNVVVADEDHCLCVLLVADGGAALAPSGGRVTLFSGYVGYATLCEARTRKGAGAGGGLAGVLFGGGNEQPNKAERIVMRGPGGRGGAEVAVTEVGAEGEGGGDGEAGKGRRLLRGIGRALGTVVGAVTDRTPVPRVRASSLGGAGGEPAGGAANIQLQCSLLSVCLSWDTLLSDILFKGGEAS